MRCSSSALVIWTRMSYDWFIVQKPISVIDKCLLDNIFIDFLVQQTNSLNQWVLMNWHVRAKLSSRVCGCKKARDHCWPDPVRNSIRNLFMFDRYHSMFHYPPPCHDSAWTTNLVCGLPTPAMVIHKCTTALEPELMRLDSWLSWTKFPHSNQMIFEPHLH